MGKLVALLAVALLLALLLFPRRVPRWLRALGRAAGEAGRAGRELLSGEEEPGSALARYEALAGEALARKILARRAPARDPELQRRVEAIGSRLAARARRREIPYRFLVLEDAEPGAFAVAGGAVFVTRGLVELSGGDDGALAGVLSHEIVHIDRRHAIQALAARAAARVASRALLAGRGALLRQLTRGMEELLLGGYSQDREFEADRLGAELARAAGYDPLGLVRALERLEALASHAPSAVEGLAGYFQSHPPVAERIARLHRA